jgi:hypothetical protein
MPILFGVNHHGTNHRFIKKMVVTLKADGATMTEQAGSALGKRRWSLPDTTKQISVLAEIAPAANSTSTKKILSVAQTFSVGGSPGAPVLTPTASTPGGFAPRVTPGAGFGAPTKPGGLFAIDLDLTFLDVTQHAKNLKTGPATFTFPNGSRFVLLESTQDTPFCWIVCLPPALSSSATNIGALTFFRPTLSVTYTNADDVSGAVSGTDRYFTNAAASPPFGLGDASRFPSYQSIGWEKQLVASGKAVALLYPLPHTSSYGSLATGSLHSLSASAVTALWAEGHVGAGGKATLSRFAVGGYSHGGRMALAAFNADSSLVDEVYLFDPAGFASPPTKAWLTATSGRRLRMIGGGYHLGAMLAHEKTLASANATCWPPTADFWATNAFYHSGLSHKAGKPERLDPVSSAGSATLDPDGPSGHTGIFVVSVTPGTAPPTTTQVHVRAIFASGTPATLDNTFVGLAHEEVAAILRVRAVDGVMTSAGQPGKIDQKHFAAAINAVTSNTDPDAHEPVRINAIRHEWTVFGGMELSPGAGYRGFFQHCLERSGF